MAKRSLVWRPHPPGSTTLSATSLSLSLSPFSSSSCTLTSPLPIRPLPVHIFPSPHLASGFSLSLSNLYSHLFGSIRPLPVYIFSRRHLCSGFPPSLSPNSNSAFVCRLYLPKASPFFWVLSLSLSLLSCQFGLWQPTSFQGVTFLSGLSPVCDQMGACLSSPVEVGGGRAPRSEHCCASGAGSWSRRGMGRKGGGLFDRREGRKRGELSDPGELVAVAGGGGGLSEDELHRLTGRMFLNGSSEVACLFTQQGRKGTNQDAMLVWENFASRNDTIFCGVFDGHGPFGHMVAKKVRDVLPLKLCTQWKANSNDQNSLQQNVCAPGSMYSEETASIGNEDEWAEPIDGDEDKRPDMYLALRQSFLKAFKLMDKELKLHPTLDCFCSGTTAVTLVKQGQDLVLGNVGDSRAVLGTRDKDNSLVAVQLTVDLKPNLPREAARIQQCKGRVFALQDEPEVARVWLPNSDSPGLAMARAFGDFCLKDYGLISVPDIYYRRLTERDEFIVLATDGVWDVLSNKEVVDVIASAPTRATAARALVDTAVRAWRLKFPTSKIDDCAVVCLFLDPNYMPNQTQESKYKRTCEVEEENVIKFGDQAIAGENMHELDSESTQLNGSLLGHQDYPGIIEEIVPESEPKEEKLHERCQSTRSLAEYISTTEEEWSALEGVTRVNSLVNLPRFLSDDKKTANWKKWL